MGVATAAASLLARRCRRGSPAVSVSGCRASSAPPGTRNSGSASRNDSDLLISTATACPAGSSLQMAEHGSTRDPPCSASALQSRRLPLIRLTCSGGSPGRRLADRARAESRALGASVGRGTPRSNSARSQRPLADAPYERGTRLTAAGESHLCGVQCSPPQYVGSPTVATANGPLRHRHRPHRSGIRPRLPPAGIRHRSSRLLPTTARSSASTARCSKVGVRVYRSEGRHARPSRAPGRSLRTTTISAPRSHRPRAVSSSAAVSQLPGSCTSSTAQHSTRIDRSSCSNCSSGSSKSHARVLTRIANRGLWRCRSRSHRRSVVPLHA